MVIVFMGKDENKEVMGKIYR
jgi:hypothetical protein